ncbi:Pre-mRNA-splicing factor [Blastocladiella emersonii ATCC 22665]|nr:Pre-mRNA-splicing factor [Blastocladiella emersonii ATCC 22665]
MSSTPKPVIPNHNRFTGTIDDAALRKRIAAQVAEWVKRPARRQADPDAANDTQKVYEGTYNIWYNKWTGQTHKGRFEFGERAPSRVNVPKDTGFTLADKRKTQNPSHRTYFCLLFARGACRKGHKCEYLHRIPLPDDPEETMKDCFGRERHRDERDDNNGVGSFNREGRSLYIGGMHPYEKGDAEKVIRKHFLAFGPLDKLNVIYDKTIAFVRYEKRANAEFAKEAMEHQVLDAGEVVRVRWANDDPNPREIEDAKKRREREFVEGYVAKKARTGETEFMDDEAKKLIEANPIYQQYYQYYEEEQTKAIEEGGAGSSSSAAATDKKGKGKKQLALPPTPSVGADGLSTAAAPEDATEPAAAASTMTEEEIQQAYYAQYYAQFYGTYGEVAATESSSTADAPTSTAAAAAPPAPAAEAPKPAASSSKSKLVAYDSDEDEDDE